MGGDQGPTEPLDVGGYLIEVFQGKTKEHVGIGDELTGPRAEPNPFGEKNLENIIVRLEERPEKRQMKAHEGEGHEKGNRARMVVRKRQGTVEGILSWRFNGRPPEKGQKHRGNIRAMGELYKKVECQSG